MSIVALFDMSGYSLMPWAETGEQCFALDILNSGRIETFPSGGAITYLNWDARDPEAFHQVNRLDPSILFSFAPCTDLTVAGAKHFASKRAANPLYLSEAIELVTFAKRFVDRVKKVAWYFENPVGVVSTVWRKPDFTFNPSDYGGYLHPFDSHPEFPEYIDPRDGYQKRTCIWGGNGFVVPSKLGVPYITFVDKSGGQISRQASQLGGKSAKTKQIRSLTPRGWCRAVFEANYAKTTGKVLPELPRWRLSDKSIILTSNQRTLI